MDAMECLTTRRSVRNYESRAVPRAMIEQIVNAGHLAASARNVQPWDFVVVTEPELRKKLAQTTDHGPFIADAPVCIVVMCADTKYYLEDGAAATQNLLNATRALGLGSCWVAGDKKPYADTVCRLVGAPEKHKLIALVAVGYAAATPSPDKRPVEDVLHWETF